MDHEIRNSLKRIAFEKLQELQKRKLEANFKKDRSLVTEMDLYITQRTQEIFQKKLPGLHFLSEEQNTHELQFPAVILDPIDGTKEFYHGYRECVISLAIMYSSEISDPRNFAWIYNPRTGFEIASDQIFLDPHQQRRNPRHVLISQYEWEHDLHAPYRQEENIFTPLGSIAFKLALLATGAADEVISIRDKNIWDIAAGTLLCAQRGISFYHQERAISHLEQIKYSGHSRWF